MEKNPSKARHTLMTFLCRIESPRDPSSFSGHRPQFSNEALDPRADRIAVKSRRDWSRGSTLSIPPLKVEIGWLDREITADLLSLCFFASHMIGIPSLRRGREGCGCLSGNGSHCS